MRLPNAKEFLEKNFPWLVADWNGADWESEKQQMRRRVNALEVHVQELEHRYMDLENLYLVHSQGQNHRAPKPKLPDPDKDSNGNPA